MVAIGSSSALKDAGLEGRMRMSSKRCENLRIATTSNS